MTSFINWLYFLQNPQKYFIDIHNSPIPPHPLDFYWLAVYQLLATLATGHHPPFICCRFYLDRSQISWFLRYQTDQEHNHVDHVVNEVR